MNDDFAHPAWAEAHRKFAADADAGLARLARWLRRRAEAKDDTEKTAAPHAGDAWRLRRD